MLATISQQKLIQAGVAEHLRQRYASLAGTNSTLYSVLGRRTATALGVLTVHATIVQFYESRDVPNNNWKTVNWCVNTIYYTNILRTVYNMGYFWCDSVLLLCILYSVTSFNLEPRIPVIKFGEPGSYFGFSVAEHLTIKEDGSQISW